MQVSVIKMELNSKLMLNLEISLHDRWKYKRRWWKPKILQPDITHPTSVIICQILLIGMMLSGFYNIQRAHREFFLIFRGHSQIAGFSNVD